MFKEEKQPAVQPAVKVTFGPLTAYNPHPSTQPLYFVSRLQFEVTVPMKLLKPTARLPEYMTEHAAGMDLFACLDDPDDKAFRITAGYGKLVKTGVAIELPPGFEAQVRPRSGLAMKHCVTVLNAPGTIDADYRGEICVLLFNHSRHDHYYVKHHDRIAQLVIAPVARAVPKLVEELSDTKRGSGGFGHTG